ncbi:MAG: thiamine-phosphate diphosphorylase, partial [Euryarchaeota archaeon RBG_13_31_8]
MMFSEIDFYFITDSNLSRKGIFSDVKDAIKAGCKIIQYREKNKDFDAMVNEAKLLKKRCNGKAIFLVNDRLNVALAVDADGVHIGKSDVSYIDARKMLGDKKIIGLSVDNVEEAIDAENVGADYVGLGPIFETSTKKDVGKPCGIDMLKNVRKNIMIPIVAIGGVTKKNVAEVILNGANAASSVSAVVGSDDVYKEVYDFI